MLDFLRKKEGVEDRVKEYDDYMAHAKKTITEKSKTTWEKINDEAETLQKELTNVYFNAHSFEKDATALYFMSLWGHAQRSNGSEAMKPANDAYNEVVSDSRKAYLSYAAIVGDIHIHDILLSGKMEDAADAISWLIRVGGFEKTPDKVIQTLKEEISIWKSFVDRQVQHYEQNLKNKVPGFGDSCGEYDRGI